MMVRKLLRLVTPVPFVLWVLHHIAMRGLLENLPLLKNPPTITLIEALTLTALLMMFERARTVEKLVQDQGERSTSIRVFQKWNEKEVIGFISAAKKSIVIVDSYFDEAPHLRTWVRDALRAGATSISVKMYLLWPKKPFGAQRLKEQRTHKEKTAPSGVRPHLEQYKQSLETDISLDDLKNYEAGFDGDVRAIRASLSDLSQIHLEIYTYPTMPETRLIIIDETNFLFGWFPLSAGNPDYLCFFVHQNPFSEADKEVIACLTEQLKNIQDASTLLTESGISSVPILQLVRDFFWRPFQD
jgi:hypothetical protein